MSVIQTYTGQSVNPFDPDPSTIRMTDIAWALSNICRFTGHSSSFYSVAQHSVLMLEELRKAGASRELQACALLHDASEAYLADIARPIKQHPAMAFYREAEYEMMRCIHRAFNLPFPLSDADNDIIKQADLRMLASEKRDLMVDVGVWPGLPAPYTRRIDPVTPVEAYACFRDELFDLLKGQTGPALKVFPGLNFCRFGEYLISRVETEGVFYFWMFDDIHIDTELDSDLAQFIEAWEELEVALLCGEKWAYRALEWYPGGIEHYAEQAPATLAVLYQNGDYDWATPGVFGVDECDIFLLRESPELLYALSATVEYPEPAGISWPSCLDRWYAKFSVMAIDSVTELAKLLVWMYDTLGPNSSLTRRGSRYVGGAADDDSDVIFFDCRQYMQP